MGARPARRFVAERSLEDDVPCRRRQRRPGRGVGDGTLGGHGRTQAQPEPLNALQKKVEGELATIWKEFSTRFAENNYQAAYRVFRELQFLYKLLDEIREAEDKLLGY